MAASSSSSDEVPATSVEIQLQTPASGAAAEAWSSSYLARSNSATPRSRQPSPKLFSSFSSSSSFANASRLSLSPFGTWEKLASIWSVSRRQQQKMRKVVGGGLRGWRQQQQQQQQRRRRSRGGSTAWILGLMVFFFLVNWWMFSRLQEPSVRRKDSSEFKYGEWANYEKSERPHRLMYTRLLALAAHALAEAVSKPEPKDLWQEPLILGSSWIPCADRRSWEISEGKNGYILVSANGGINQQRVAICNAVAIARLLDSTLVLPRFLNSSVWKDTSKFSDIYQEEHFINYLKADIRIVKELPVELQSLDLEAIGSVVTDAEVMKESKPSYYLKKILPILLKNRVVHFVGFGNRLAFDPIPFELQRLRCRCNFHALQFVDKIQETGALLVHRMHHHFSHWGRLEDNLLGLPLVKSKMNGEKNPSTKISRYLAVHLRFEIDMAAHSMCYFGGGKDEEKELEAYRAVHFPALTLLKKTTKIPSAAFLRSEGQCPLTPEEAVLMLAALGFKRKTSVYIAGSHIYGGKSRMAAFTSLYPNLATKESLLSSSEIKPFLNFSSQLAALDFIACAAADAFAITDSGSQFSSLVSGYRLYYGGGKRPTIRPNKRRLASIFLKNATIEWKEFEGSVRKAVRQSKQLEERPVARSIYRHPRCLECMCQIE